MAKIDISKIENFENLTAEELRDLITGFEYEDKSADFAKIQAENQKLLKAKDEATSQAADFKRQLREKQSEQERLEAEKAEELERLKTENAAFKQNALISEYKANALGMGYSDDLAQRRAEAMASNDFKAMNDIDKEFLADHDRKLSAETMRQTPRPSGGNGNPEVSISKATFDAMGYRERVQLLEKDPELYAELSK